MLKIINYVLTNGNDHITFSVYRIMKKYIQLYYSHFLMLWD